METINLLEPKAGAGSAASCVTYKTDRSGVFRFFWPDGSKGGLRIIPGQTTFDGVCTCDAVLAGELCNHLKEAAVEAKRRYPALFALVDGVRINRETSKRYVRQKQCSDSMPKNGDRLFYVLRQDDEQMPFVVDAVKLLVVKKCLDGSINTVDLLPDLVERLPDEMDREILRNLLVGSEVFSGRLHIHATTLSRTLATLCDSQRLIYNNGQQWVKLTWAGNDVPVVFSNNRGYLRIGTKQVDLTRCWATFSSGVFVFDTWVGITPIAQRNNKSRHSSQPVIAEPASRRGGAGFLSLPKAQDDDRLLRANETLAFGIRTFEDAVLDYFVTVPVALSLVENKPRFRGLGKINADKGDDSLSAADWVLLQRLADEGAGSCDTLRLRPRHQEICAELCGESRLWARNPETNEAEAVRWAGACKVTLDDVECSASGYSIGGQVVGNGMRTPLYMLGALTRNGFVLGDGHLGILEHEQAMPAVLALLKAGGRLSGSEYEALLGTIAGGDTSGLPAVMGGLPNGVMIKNGRGVFRLALSYGSVELPAAAVDELYTTTNNTIIKRDLAGEGKLRAAVERCGMLIGASGAYHVPEEKDICHFVEALVEAGIDVPEYCVADKLMLEISAGRVNTLSLLFTVGVADNDKVFAKTDAVINKTLDGQLPMLKPGLVLPETASAALRNLAPLGRLSNNAFRINAVLLRTVYHQLASAFQIKVIDDIVDKVNCLTDDIDTSTLLPSSGFTGELKNFQMDGFRWLVRVANVGMGTILADEMGAGKTIQTLAMITHFTETHPCEQPFLIVADLNGLATWQNEARKFAPCLRVAVAGGKSTERAALYAQSNLYDAIIINYHKLKNDCKSLQKITWRGIILDEAQSIKNDATQINKAVRKLSCSIRLAVTGTPVENSIGDFWTLMDWLNPGLLSTYGAVDIRKVEEPKQIEAAQHLAGMAVLQRRKENVLDLPEKKVIEHFLEMTDMQREAYESAREQARSSVSGLTEAAFKLNKISAFAELLAMRLACLHPGIRNQNMKKEVSPKVEFLLEHLQNEVLPCGNKAIVFSEFLLFCREILPALEKCNIKYDYIKGSTPRPQRDKLIEQFQTGDDLQVMVMSTRSCCNGITLTKANHCYLMDLQWNPQKERQAMDRIHRIGQTQSVMIHKLVMANSIEEEMLALQKHKLALAEQILGVSSTGETANSLNFGEFMRLLDV